MLVQNQGDSSNKLAAYKSYSTFATCTEFSEAKIGRGVEGLDSVRQLLLQSVKDNYSVGLIWTEAMCS